MIGAWVVELQDGDDTRVNRGFFQFAQLPAPGDRVTIPNDRRTWDVLGVFAVEHTPVPFQPGSPVPAREPTATIYVQWIKEESGR